MSHVLLTIPPELVVQIVPWLIGAIGGLFGLWRNKKLSTTRKVLESVVIGVEAAGRMPQVTGSDKLIKRQIRMRAYAAGVEPVLKELVKRVAEPQVNREEDAIHRESAAAGADRP